ncbi:MULTISPECIES: nuclease-related domain-containing protein [unclassified Variovorax]|uniref:nuclease-related domain-containing protein n=1 Tax=unclassified Variovorax TaxID=663243 RepID=UPI0008C8717C|nr:MULTISPECIES: nuclease-related domain-containing protein [unclassified Variovorax]SEK13976.1 Nuclease-related domain-containing protein [Variovorax sp. OK202]SFD93500.1 Nuclease-related domain-containing protein [Variovorax sp. OK212]
MTTALHKVPVRPVLTLPGQGHPKPDTGALARRVCAIDSEQANTTATALGIQQLAAAFQPAFGRMHVLKDLVIPMYDGSAVPTARFDVALVCEAGVYLFEVKGWRNAVVYRKTSAHTVPRWFLRQRGNSLAREVKDPAWQCGRKTTHLRSLLPSDLRVQYFVLLPFEGVELEGVMPTVVITPQDLPYIARVARNNGRTEQGYPMLDDAAIDRTLQLLSGLQGELTVDDHLRNSRDRSERGAPMPARAHAQARPTHPGLLKLQ